MNGKPYGPILARAILEYQKVAKQRANTGARLRVIRELVGMPIALTAAQVSKPVLFGRIVQNTDYILQTPEGRAMATAQALDVDMATLFGSRKPELPTMTENADNTSEPEDTGPGVLPLNDDAANLAADASADDEPDFPGDDEGEGQQETEFVRLTDTLEEYMSFKEYLNVTTKSGTNPYELAQAEFENKNANVESRTKMIKRVKDFLIAKKVPGVV
jgi:hypothetical protein